MRRLVKKGSCQFQRSFTRRVDDTLDVLFARGKHPCEHPLEVTPREFMNLTSQNFSFTCHLQAAVHSEPSVSRAVDSKENLTRGPLSSGSTALSRPSPTNQSHPRGHCLHPVPKGSGADMQLKPTALFAYHLWLITDWNLLHLHPLLPPPPCICYLYVHLFRLFVKLGSDWRLAMERFKFTDCKDCGGADCDKQR